MPEKANSWRFSSEAAVVALAAVSEGAEETGASVARRRSLSRSWSPPPSSAPSWTTTTTIATATTTDSTTTTTLATTAATTTVTTAAAITTTTADITVAITMVTTVTDGKLPKNRFRVFSGRFQICTEYFGPNKPSKKSLFRTWIYFMRTLQLGMCTNVVINS